MAELDQGRWESVDAISPFDHAQKVVGQHLEAFTEVFVGGEALPVGLADQVAMGDGIRIAPFYRMGDFEATPSLTEVPRLDVNLDSALGSMDCNPISHGHCGFSTERASLVSGRCSWSLSMARARRTHPFREPPARCL